MTIFVEKNATKGMMGNCLTTDIQTTKWVTMPRRGITYFTIAAFIINNV